MFWKVVHIYNDLNIPALMAWKQVYLINNNHQYKIVIETRTLLRILVLSLDHKIRIVKIAFCTCL